MLRFDADQRKVIQQAKLIQRTARQQATKTRPKSPRADRGRERDPGFLAFLRRQPCAVRHMGGCSGPIQAAHIRYSDAAKGSINPGLQRRNHDRLCNPLCEGHHIHDQHRRNERSFWEAAGIDPYDNAARLYAEYKEE